MKRLILALIVLLAGALPAQALDIQTVDVPGVGTAWLVENHSLPIIAVQLAFRNAGTAQDPQAKEGTATFVAGLLNEGAGDMDAAAFQQRLEELAIEMSFAAERDESFAVMKTLTENRREAFRLLGLALSQPRFDADAIERVRQQLFAAVAQAEQTPSAVAAKRWYAAAFAGHPYGRPKEGSVDSLKVITRDDLRAFAASHFARGSLVIAIVGDVTPEEAKALLGQAFGALPEKATPAAVAEVKASPPAGIEVVNRPIPQSTFVFGHAGIKRDDPDWYAAQVMNYTLGGGGFSSRLVNKVREKRGLAYYIYTIFAPFDHAGIMLGSVGTQNERAAESIDIIRTEITKMRDGGATEAELALAKKYLTGSYPLSFASSGKIAGELVALQLDGFAPDFVAKRNAYIEAVTLDDVNRVAKRLLSPENLHWVVVGAPDGVTSTVPVVK